MKFSKSNIFYLIASYFMLFAFVGALFNVIAYAIAWSVSIFIILWCAFWFVIYCRDMYYEIEASIEIMKEDLQKQIEISKNKK